MKRVLPGLVGLVGVLLLLGGGIGTLVSLAQILGNGTNHLGRHFVALAWALSGLLLGFAVLSTRFLLYAVGTIVLTGETIGAWVTGHNGPALYATILTAALLAYGWRWLGELGEEESPEPSSPPAPLS